MITSTGENAALATTKSKTNSSSSLAKAGDNPSSALNKDDFMQLLLLEMKYQDPTDPMDSDKILQQTSQLATLESADNTNNALEKLSKSLESSQQFSTISAIGKMADLGNDSIAHDEGKTSTFEVYFPEDIKEGTLEIKDNSGNLVKSLNINPGNSGVYKFDWDGNNEAGKSVSSGIFHVSANYTNSKGDALQTRLGTYPIDAVRFDKGNAEFKLGSNYVPIGQVKEVF